MAFTFGALRRLQLGGFSDCAALLSIAGGTMATHPVLAPSSWTAATALGVSMGFGGGAWLGNRVGDVLQPDTLDGTLRINSSRPPPATEDGMHLGYIVDTGEPLIVPMSEFMRHQMIVGQSGVGKTVMGNWQMAQQIARGGGLLWIDGKLDPDNVNALRAMCSWAGRQDDLLIVSPGDPDASNSYNPILFGDSDEVSARCLSLIPSAETNPGADFYRQEANQGIATLVTAIQACGLGYNFADMTVLLSNAEALTWLEQRVPYGTPAQQQLSLFLHRFKVPVKGGGEQIDVKKLKDTLGGIGGRMFSFGTGKFGQVLNTYSPEVRLKDDMLANRIIYVALPTMAKAEAAGNFGKMVTGDFRTAIAQIQALPKSQRPDPPFLSFFDECGSYVTQAWSRIFEQSRSAKIVMAPAFQTKANLEVLGEELRDMVAGNTVTKIFFKPGEPNTAEWMADMIGMEQRSVYSISANKGAGGSKASHLSANPGGATHSDGVGFTERTEEDHKITPTELMKLGKGEAIITYDGSNVYHVRVPMLDFSGEIMEEALLATINRRRVQRSKGLDLTKNIDRWVGRREDADR